MSVAVTGASGLIGWPLAVALSSVDEVVAIDRRPAPAAPPDGMRFVQRDVRDPELAADLAGADALVHLAFSELDARAAVASLEATRQAVRTALDAGVATVVHASSATVYGSGPDVAVPLREDDLLQASPGFAYPATKVATERMLDELASGVRLVHLRPTTTLGPGAGLLLAGRAYVSLSDFDPPLQFTWVDDVVDAFVAALRAPRASGAFNVGAPGTIRASEVAGVLGVRSLRLPYRVRRPLAAALTRLRAPGALDPGFVDLARYPIVVDAARAERELGWRPRLDSVGALKRFRDLALNS